VTLDNQAAVMFRRFSDGTVEHRDGDLAVARADLNAQPLSWAVDYLSSDNQSNWKVAFAVDRETGHHIVSSVKQSPFTAGLTAARALDERVRAACLEPASIVSGGPLVASMTFADLPDLAIVPADIALSDPRPADGQEITITVSVRNQGLRTIRDAFTVKLYDGDPSVRPPVASRTVADALPLHGSLPLTFRYVTGRAGPQPIHIVLDRENAVAELNEANNAAGVMLGVVPPPRNVVAVPNNNSNDILLSWAPPEGNEPFRFTVYRKTAGGDDLELLGTTTDSSFTDVFAQPGWEYQYVLVAEDSFGATSTSSFSATVVLEPALGIRRAGGSIILSWPHPSPGFVLQEVSAMGNRWVAVAQTPTLQDGQNVLSLPVGSGPRFYRLRRP